jgi:hypothetical protein
MAAIGWVLAIASLGLACCDPMDRPPRPPPKPTDPTSVAERAPADVLDASIVTDGGAGWDGAGFELDTGVTPNRDRAHAEGVAGVTRAHFVATGHAP